MRLERKATVINERRERGRGVVRRDEATRRKASARVGDGGVGEEGKEAKRLCGGLGLEQQEAGRGVLQEVLHGAP